MLETIIATNIRRCRESLSWTQEQLAAAARLSTRTVQRAEDKGAMSAETLLAIAGALDVTVDDLRRDFDAEEWAKMLANVKARYDVIDMRRIDSPSDVAASADALAIVFEVAPEADTAAVRDVAAQLNDYLREALDCWSDVLTSVQQREMAKAIHEIIEHLRVLGCVVTAGLHRAVFKYPQSEPFEFPTMIWVVAPTDEPKMVVMMDKTAPVRLASA